MFVECDVRHKVEIYRSWLLLLFSLRLYKVSNRFLCPKKLLSHRFFFVAFNRENTVLSWMKLKPVLVLSSKQ